MLQSSDSAFPTGGFAHSGGLEAAWQSGEVRVARGARAVRARRALAGRAWRPAARIRGMRDPRRLEELDRRLPRVPDQRRREPGELRAGPRVPRRARGVWPGESMTRRSRIAWRAAERPPRAGFRRRAVALGVPLETTQQLFLYIVVARPGLGRRPARHRRRVRRPATAGRLRGEARAVFEALRHLAGYRHRADRADSSICFRPGTIGSTRGCFNRECVHASEIAVSFPHPLGRGHSRRPGVRLTVGTDDCRL